MGRYKSVQIKGLFFEKFNEIFEEAFVNALKNQNLSKKQIAEKLAPELEALIESYEHTIAEMYVDNHKFNINTFLKTHFESQRQIAISNQNSFIPFTLYVNACVTLYEDISKKILRKKIDSTLRLNVVLYGLVVRRAMQIVDMLINGYIDGAMIIWRSLYENAVILLVFALENDATLSDKFYSHSIRNSSRKAVSYTENLQALKFKPLSKRILNSIELAKKQAESTYGKEFMKNEYWWADHLFPGKADFKLLSEKAQMNKYRPYYMVCSEQTHANFSGFKPFMERNKIMLPKLLEQEIDIKSFIDPMQFTISVLHDVNDYILYEFSTPEEYNVNLLLLDKIFEKLQNSYS